MKKVLVKHLKPSHEVTVIHDTPHAFHSTKITASELVAANFGDLELESDEEGQDDKNEDATLVLASLDDYNLVRAAVGGQRVLPVMGRPPLPETKRASEQIQLRVTAEQKKSYTAAAARARRMNVSEWIKDTLDTAAAKTS
ncbi:MAG TPA: hypothetical protein VHY30_02255 [Verrucomicrobiae bacterium]|jgi:hypothetical protein|nr:hypothetical protein [Verrucomicrobiae bacterium]